MHRKIPAYFRINNKIKLFKISIIIPDHSAKPSEKQEHHPVAPSHRLKGILTRRRAGTDPFHFLKATPAEHIKPDRVLGMLDQLLQPALHFQKLLFAEIRAFKHGFLDPISIGLDGFDDPVSNPVVHDIEAHHEKHGGYASQTKGG